jgi:hypothetical protein
MPVSWIETSVVYKFVQQADLAVAGKKLLQSFRDWDQKILFFLGNPLRIDAEAGPTAGPGVESSFRAERPPLSPRSTSLRVRKDDTDGRRRNSCHWTICETLPTHRHEYNVRAAE